MYCECTPVQVHTHAHTNTDSHSVRCRKCDFFSSRERDVGDHFAVREIYRQVA